MPSIIHQSNSKINSNKLNKFCRAQKISEQSQRMQIQRKRQTSMDFDDLVSLDEQQMGQNSIVFSALNDPIIKSAVFDNIKMIAYQELPVEDKNFQYDEQMMEDSLENQENINNSQNKRQAIQMNQQQADSKSDHRENSMQNSVKKYLINLKSDQLLTIEQQANNQQINSNTDNTQNSISDLSSNQKRNGVLNLKDLVAMDQKQIQKLNSNIKNQTFLTLADDEINNFALQKQPIDNQQTLKTQVCAGIYNSTGPLDEIDEKVFISNSKKSQNKTRQLTSEADMKHASQTSKIAERFLKMECDQSNDNGDSLENDKAEQVKQTSKTIEKRNTGMKVGNQQARLRNIRAYSSDQEIITKIYEQVKPLETFVPNKRKQDERQRYSSQQVLQIFSQNNSDMGANKSYNSRQDNDKHTLNIDDLNSQSNPTSMITGSKFVKQKNQSNLPQIPCSLKVYVNEDHVFKQRYSALRSPFAYQTNSLMNTNENMFSNGFTQLGESVNFLNEGAQSANSTTLQQPLTNKYPSSTFGRPQLAGYPLFRGPNLFTSSSANSQRFQQFHMHYKHKSAISGGPNESVACSQRNDLACERSTFQNINQTPKVNQKLQMSKVIFNSLVSEIVGITKQQLCQQCSEKGISIEQTQINSLFQKYCNPLESEVDATQDGNIKDTVHSNSSPVAKKIQKSLDKGAVAAKIDNADGEEQEERVVVRQEEAGKTESINNSPIQLFTINSSNKNQSNQKSLMNTSKLGRDYSLTKNLKREGGSQCLNINLQRCVTGGSSRGASNKKKYQCIGGMQQNHQDTQKRLQRVLMGYNEGEFSRNLSGSQVDYSLSLSNQGCKVQNLFEKQGLSKDIGCSQEELDELNRGYQVENEEDEEYDHVSLLPSSYVMANIEKAKAEKAKAKRSIDNMSKSKNSKKERSKSSNHSIFEQSDHDQNLLQNQVKTYQASSSPPMLSTQIKQIIMGGKQFQKSPSYNYIKNLSSQKKKRSGKKTIYVDDLDVKRRSHMISGNHDSCNINDSCAEHASENYISFANQISNEYQVQFYNKRADERLPQSNVPQISIAQPKDKSSHPNSHMIRSIHESARLDGVQSARQVRHYFTERSPNLETQINANFDDLGSSQKKPEEQQNDALSPIKKFSIRSSKMEVGSYNLRSDSKRNSQGPNQNQNVLEETRKQPLSSKPKIDAHHLNQMQASRTRTSREVKDFKVFNFQNKSKAYQITQQNNSLISKMNQLTDCKSDSKGDYYPPSAKIVGTVPQTAKAEMIQGIQKHRNSVQNFFSNNNKLSIKTGQSSQMSEQKPTTNIMKTFDGSIKTYDGSINMAEKNQKYQFDERNEYYNLKDANKANSNKRVHHVCQTQIHKNIFQKGKHPQSASYLFKSSQVDSAYQKANGRLTSQRTLPAVGSQGTEMKQKNAKEVKQFFVIEKKKGSLPVTGTGMPQPDAQLKSCTATHSNLQSMHMGAPVPPSHRPNPSKLTLHSREDSSVRQEFSYANSEERVDGLTKFCEQKISRLSNPFRFDSTCNIEDVADECTNEVPQKIGHKYKNLTIDVEEIEKFHHQLVEGTIYNNNQEPVSADQGPAEQNAENYQSATQAERQPHQQVPPENSYMSLESFKNKLGKAIVQNIKIS